MRVKSQLLAPGVENGEQEALLSPTRQDSTIFHPFNRLRGYLGSAAELLMRLKPVV